MAKDPSIGGGRADEQPWSAKSPVRVFGATKSLTELGSHVWHSRHYIAAAVNPNLLIPSLRRQPTTAESGAECRGAFLNENFGRDDRWARHGKEET